MAVEAHCHQEAAVHGHIQADHSSQMPCSTRLDQGKKKPSECLAPDKS